MTPLRVAGFDGSSRIKAWRSALAAASCAGCLLGLVVAPASAQQESLNGTFFNDPNVQITNVQCQVDGRSTFDFRATGVIEHDPFPPFPPYKDATWTETGRVVIGRQVQFNSSGQLFPDGPWVKLTASFTMTATDGTVIKGTKKLADATYDFPANEAVCVAFPIPTAPDVTSGYAWGGTSNRLEYDATITGPPGTKTKCKDRGDAYLTFGDANYVLMGAPQVFRSFFELFTSTSFKC